MSSRVYFAMNQKTLLIIGAVAIALIGVIGLSIFLLQSQQNTRSNADNGVSNPTTIPTSAPGASVGTNQANCALPSQVQNVKIDFPNCVGDQCNFTQAGCSWTALPGATKYQVTVTQVDDGTSISNEQLDGAVTNKVFDVKDGFTYKCDVAAINSCGTAGAAGSNTLLCKVDAAVDTPAPTPPPVACGSPCTDSSQCQAGYVCATGTGGQGNCSLPAATSACQASPSQASCCSVPTPTIAPTVPPTGEIGTTVTLGVGAVIMVIVGALLFAL